MARMRKTTGVRGTRRPISGMTARVGGSVRRDRASLLRSTALQASFALVLLFPVTGQADPAANARPQGGSVVAGSAAIVNTATLTAINQSSQRAAINWTSFDVGSKQAVQFNQPNSSAITLNRVTGSDPSQIAGQITANGTIVLTNPSGVVFSQGAQVNAQTVLVTTADISNQNFMAGKLVFDTAGKPNAMIVNAGTISVAQSGLAALVAPAVANSGTIVARMGTVVLAGAATHTVDLYGDGLLAIDVTKQVGQAPVGPDGQAVKALVTNTGVIRADGGTVLLTAQAVDGIVGTLVDAGGKISADSAGSRTGTVVLRGVGGSLTIEGEVSAAGGAAGSKGGSIEANATNAVVLAATARVNASGVAGGGTVALGTTLARAAGGPAVVAATAKSVTVAQGAQVSARGTGGSSAGGNVTVLSTERTDMAGSIVASGGVAGGFVEVSGKTGYSLTGSIDVSAALGVAGSILIDPTDLTIGATNTDDGFVSSTNPKGILAGDVLTAANGFITPASFTGLTGNVTLQAANNLTVSADVLNAQATNLILQAGNNLTISNTITTTGGNISLTAAASGTNFVTVASGKLTINQALNAGTGTITLSAGTGGIATNAAGILTAGVLTGTSTGAVALSATNQVGTLGAFGVTGADFAMTNGAALVIAGAVSGNNIRLVNTNAGGITFSDGTVAGRLSVASGGTIGLRTDALVTATPVATDGTLSAPSGVIEIAPNSVATLGIELAGSATRLGFAPSTFTFGSGITTLRLGATGGTVLATNITTATSGNSNVSASAATLDLRATTSIAVTSTLTAGSTVRLAAPTVSLGDATHAGRLVETAAGGTISVQSDAFTAGAGGGTLSTNAGVIEVAAQSVANIGLETASVAATTLGFAPSTFTLSAAVLRLGSVAGVTGSAAIDVTNATDLTAAGHGAATLDLETTGAVTQTAGKTLKVGTLKGAAGSVTLGVAGNAITTLDTLSGTTGVSVTDSAAVTVPGTATLTGSNITLSDSFASTAGTPAITVAGTLSSAGTIRLSATTASAGNTGIALAGKVGTTALPGTTTTLDLNTAGSNISDASGGVLLVNQLISSGGIAGNVTLTTSTNQVARLGAMTVTSGTLSLRDSVAVTVNSGALVQADGVTLRDDFVSNGGTPAITVAGTLRAATTGTVQVNATDAGTGVTAITLTGTLGNSAGTVDLISGGGNVVESGGVLNAAVLTSSGAAKGAVTLTNAANAISTLAAFSTQGGDFLLTDSAALTVNATASTGTGANLRLVDSHANGISLGAAGALVTSGGTLSLQTDMIAAGATSAALTATNGVVELATDTPGRALSLGVTSISGALLGFNPAAYTLASTTLRVGAVNGAVGSSAINVGASTDLTGRASTLDVQTTGPLGQGVGANLTVGTLTGNVASVLLAEPANAISIIRDLIADGSVGITNTVALSLAGTNGIVAGRQGIVPGATLSLTNTGALAIGASIGNGGTGDVTLRTVSGAIDVAAGNTISSGRNLTISAAGTYGQAGGLVNAPVVAITDGTGFSMSGGTIAASATVATYSGTGTGTFDTLIVPSITVSGGAFSQSGGVISANGAAGSVTLTPSAFSQSGGRIAANGTVSIGAGLGIVRAGQLGSRAGSNSSFTQIGGVIVAAGDINLWSSGTLTQTAGTVAAGGTLGATATGTITQGNPAVTSKAATPTAVLSGATVLLHSITAGASQGGDGIVAGGTGASNDPTTYPIRIQAPGGSNSFSVFGTTAPISTGANFVVFCPACNLGAAAQSPPTISTANPGVVGVTVPDVVLLADSISPITSGISAGRLALYSQHDTSGKVIATLLTGRAGIVAGEASNLSPYPLPDLVKAAETAFVQGGTSPYWSAPTTGNVALTASNVTNLGTIVATGTTGYGYGAIGSFSLDNSASPGPLMVMGGGAAGTSVYPGVIATGGDLTITGGGGSIEVRGPLAASGTLTVTAGSDLKITGSAVLSAGNTANLTAAGAYVQDSGLVNAPTIALKGNLFSGNAVVISGGTVSAIGPSAQLRITTSIVANASANVLQSGGVIASDNGLTIGIGSGAGTAAGSVVATTNITQSNGTLAAVGDMALYAGGTLSQTRGVIAAGGTLAATARGQITQGNSGGSITVATMSGGTVRLFTTTAGADQYGDGLVAAGANVSVDPSLYPIRIQAPEGRNGFAIFGTAAAVTVGGALFSPANNLGATTPAAGYQALTAYTPATVGATSATRPDVALLGNTILPNTGTITANNLALYSFGDTTANVVAKLLTGRGGVLTLDSTATPDFVVPALVNTVETVNSPVGGAPYWSRLADNPGNFYLPNSVTNSGTPGISSIANLGTTVAGTAYGLGATGSINIDNKAPGTPGTLTIGGPLMSWAGGIRINETGTSDVMLIASDINVASPGARNVAVSSAAVVPGLIALTANSVTLGKSGSGAGGSVTLQATMIEVTGTNDVRVLDGVTLDTGDSGANIFTRPLSGLPPKDPQKAGPSPVHVPGALFTAGLGGFTQSGTFTMQPYTPTAYKVPATAYATAAHPVLEIILSAHAGTIAFDPATAKGLVAPKVAIVLDVGTGNSTGRINADSLALFYTQLTGLPTALLGTLRTAQGVAVSDQAAATQAFIAQSGNYVPSNHFQMNGCALSSVNCVLTSLFPQIPITNPFKDLMIGRFSDPLDDPDLLLPNVSDRDY